MDNHIQLGENKYNLTDRQAEAIAAAIRDFGLIGYKEVRLADKAAGEVVTIAGVEFIVLEHQDGETALITKDCIGEDSEFGENDNRYEGSYVDDICESFEAMLLDFVSAESIVEFDLDLTSDDGLKDYGQIRRRVALMTADMYRRYVDILDLYNPGQYWWLSTPRSTKRHGADSWVKCVSPSGNVDYDFCDVGGVRPFCILKSDIFVSR